MIDDKEFDLLVEVVSDMVCKEVDSLANMFEQLLDTFAKDRERIKHLENEVEYFKTRLNSLVNREMYH